MTINQEIRKGRLTATSIPAICGLHPFRSKLDVWLEMTGRAEPFVGNEASRWGQILEAPIAERYAKDEGVTLEECSTLIHPKHDLVAGTPDRLIVERFKGLEIKTANVRQAHRWGESETDQVPEEYIGQSHVYMSITGRPEWDVAVLIGGSDYRVYRLKRDEELEEALIDEALRFHRDHLLTDIPPEIDGSSSASAWLAKRFPRCGLGVRESTSELDAMASELRALREQLEVSEGRESVLVNRLKEAIGTDAGIKGRWGVIRWSERHLSPKVDWEAVARELQAPADIVAKHTSEARVTRAFTTRWTQKES